MQAIRLDRFGVMNFSAGPIPDDVRADAARFGGEVLDGVTLDAPPGMDLTRWPEGTLRPTPTLGRSRTDAKHYRVFKYRSDFDDAGFVPTGLTYRNSEAPALRTYFRLLKRLDGIVRDTEAADSPEAWAAFEDAVAGGRGGAGA